MRPYYNNDKCNDNLYSQKTSITNHGIKTINNNKFMNDMYIHANIIFENIYIHILFIYLLRAIGSYIWMWRYKLKYEIP